MRNIISRYLSNIEIFWIFSRLGQVALVAEFPATLRFAKVLLKKILQCDGQIIHFVFKKWVTPSIKGNKRSYMEASNSSVVNCGFIGGEQTHPSQFIQTLRNKNVNSALITFLIDN